MQWKGNPTMKQRSNERKQISSKQMNSTMSLYLFSQFYSHVGPRAPEDMPSCSVHSVRRAAATLPETPFLSEIKVVACASNFRCQYAVGVVCTAKRTLRSLYRRAHPHYMLEQAHRCLARARALSRYVCPCSRTTLRASPT